MATRRYAMNEQKIARFIKEKRGEGAGANYLPWLTVQDVPSTGRVVRMNGIRTSRLHHLLSDIEAGFFLVADWDNRVKDIREAFPLPREMTREIAKEMGVRHPQDRSTKTDIVMTTDFLLTMEDATGEFLIAVSAKSATDLDNPRVIEKLEIERRCWVDHKHGSWFLVTDRDLPTQRVQTLRWLKEMYSLEHLAVPYPTYWQDRCESVLNHLEHAKNITVKQFIRTLENTGQFETGEVLTVIRHLGAAKRISVDVDMKFSLNNPISSIGTRESSDDRRRA